MNKNILIGLGIVLLCTMIASAADYQLYTEPYSQTFSTDSELGVTWPAVVSAIGNYPCTTKTYWETNKWCNFYYYCYAILPSDSTSIANSLQRECVDGTGLANVSLKINNFLPPKGVLYYVTTFVVPIKATCGSTNCDSNNWSYSVYNGVIPQVDIRVHPIRSVCPSGQMLKYIPSAGKSSCFKAERVCTDNLQTGLCSNAYTLWAIDLNQDGTVSLAEMQDGASLCADRPADLNNDGIYEYPQGDGICDTVTDLGCVDVCSKYNTAGTCTVSGANSLCDIYDILAPYTCADSVLSPNSKICDSLDSNLCSKAYDPVCWGKNVTSGIGGTTYPNKCFADAQGKTGYVPGTCLPDVVQCYVPNDCPDPNVCVGGSSVGISKACTAYRCAYSGACGNMACITDADCSALSVNVCAGVAPKCSGGICTVSGSCMQAPTRAGLNIWSLIQSYWTVFWNYIKSLVV